MAHSSRHGPRPARPLAGVLRPFPWCSPPGIGFRARPRQLSKQVPPCRSRISAAVFDPKLPCGEPSFDLVGEEGEASQKRGSDLSVVEHIVLAGDPVARDILGTIVLKPDWTFYTAIVLRDSPRPGQGTADRRDLVDQAIGAGLVEVDAFLDDGFIVLVE